MQETVSIKFRSICYKERVFYDENLQGVSIFNIQYKLDSLQDFTKCMALNGLMYMVCENHELIIN